MVLPEMWSCPYRNDAFPEYAEPLGKDGRAGPAGRLMAEVMVMALMLLLSSSLIMCCVSVAFLSRVDQMLVQNVRAYRLLGKTLRKNVHIEETCTH